MSRYESVRRILFRWYRVPVTGLCFVIFGLGTLVLSVILLLNPRSVQAGPPVRRRQRFAGAVLRFFLGIMKGVGVLERITYRGLDHLPDGGCTIVSNHPTLIDPVVLIAQFETVDCIVKEKHLRFFRVIARWLDYLSDQASLGLFDGCSKRLEAGRRLLLFPERTRSPKDGLRPFSRIPAQVTLATDSKMVPVLIECRHRTLHRDQSWYEVPPEPIEMTVTVYPPFTPDPDGSFSERSRAVTDRLNMFYRDRLGLDGK